MYIMSKHIVAQPHVKKWLSTLVDNGGKWKVATEIATQLNKENCGGSWERMTALKYFRHIFHQKGCCVCNFYLHIHLLQKDLFLRCRNSISRREQKWQDLQRMPIYCHFVLFPHRFTWELTVMLFTLKITRDINALARICFIHDEMFS